MKEFGPIEISDADKQYLAQVADRMRDFQGDIAKGLGIAPYLIAPKSGRASTEGVR